MRTLLKWLAYTGLGLVVMGALAIVLLPLVSGWAIDTVYGGSMEPAIPLRSMIVISPVDPESIQVGDVILYAPPTDTSARVTHRVVQVVEREDDRMFRTQGDANNAADPYGVPSNNVVGKIQFSIPYAGYFADFAQSQTGFLILLILPATILVASALKDVFTYSPRKERRARLLERKQRQQRLARA